jgi:hypothetical protein
MKIPRKEEPMCAGCGIGFPVSFYVTSDAPYDMAGAEKMSNHLDILPLDGDFLMHLGNIQDASVSLCSASRYSFASSTLKSSPLPTLIVPGSEDCAKCLKLKPVPL